MKDFFTNKSFKILLAAVFLIIGISIITFRYSDDIIKSVWGTITSPIQKITTKVADSASKIFEDGKSVEYYESEISSLKSEIQALNEKLVNYTELENQNKKYEGYLEIKKANDSFKFTPASVVGRDSNENFYGFMINQGSASGISVNDPVITHNGLIGRVVAVDLMSAKVETILSPDCNVGAAERATQDSGVITGNIKLADKNLTRLSYVPAQTAMEIGSLVITTGLGGIYPRNLIVGKVCELKNDDFDSSRYAIIEPMEDIRIIRDVFVITSFNGKGAVETKAIKDLLPKETKPSETTVPSEPSSSEAVTASESRSKKKEE